MLSLILFISVQLAYGNVPEPAEYILSFPTRNNPLEVKVASATENNYILLIGDWGADNSTSSDVAVQSAIAQKMISFYNEQKKNGFNLLFVGTVGDNFYYDGQSCNYYSKRWTDMYGEIATNYPWLSVLGNHDWGNDDPDAICAWGTDPRYIDPVTRIPYAANQINKHKKGCNPSNYYLPDFGYYYRIDELDFEWIGLEETVTICPSDMGGQNYKSCNGSSRVGCNYLGRMRNASEIMMNQRAQISNATNFLLSQHFPQNANRLVDTFKSTRGSKANNDRIWSVFGHNHTQECQRKDKNGTCDSILTGGGGGCCGEGTLRGFYVIGFDENKRMTQPYKMNDPLISCQYPCGKTFSDEEIVQATFNHCCYTMNNADIDCSLFDLSKC